MRNFKLDLPIDGLIIIGLAGAEYRKYIPSELKGDQEKISRYLEPQEIYAEEINSIIIKTTRALKNYPEKLVVNEAELIVIQQSLREFRSSFTPDAIAGDPKAIKDYFDLRRTYDKFIMEIDKTATELLANEFDRKLKSGEIK